MKVKKIFTPIIAVGLATSLSVGSEVNISIDEGMSPQIENLNSQQYPDGISDVSTYYYVNPSTHTLTQIHNLTFSFANRADPNRLVLESDTQGNGNIAFGGLNSVAWTDRVGLFIDTLTIDLQHSDPTPKHFSLLFGDGGEFSIAHSGYQIEKSLLKITNGTNRNDTTNITFGGVVKSDFLIDSLSTNTITFSKDLDWKSIENIGDITISGNDSKNIFNFEDVTYRGTFTNAISTDTQINLNGTTRFDSDITTNGGGLTTIHILDSQVSLEHYDKSTNAYTPLTFSTDANSKNIIDISPKLGSLQTLNSFFQGNNTVVFHDNHNIGGPGSGVLIIQTLSGNSNIDIGNNAYINLDTFSITTKKGVSNINFIGESAALFPAYYDVIFKADGGDNFFNFKKDGTFNIQAILQADNGSNHFVIDHNITLQGYFNFYSSEQSTNKNVFDIYANSSLLLQNINFDLQSGNMEINFKGSEGKGIFNGNFNNISNRGTITINTEAQAHGILNRTYFSNNLSTSTNTLNLQENSTLEVIDDEIYFHTINVLGSSANLTLSDDMRSASIVRVLNPIVGEKLIVNCDGGGGS